MANIREINQYAKKELSVKEKIATFIPFLGLAFVVIFFAILTKGNQLASSNWKVLLNEVFSMGICSAGVLFVMSTGCVDFSVAAIASASAAIAAKLVGGNVLLIFIVTIVCGMFFGFMNGFIHTKMKIPAFITTLSTQFILRGLTLLVCNGYLEVTNDIARFDGIVLKLAVLLTVFILGYIVFEYSVLGKQCRAVGAMPEAARQNGIHVEKVKIITYMISGFLCGLAAFFLLARTSSASSTTAKGLEMDVLLAVLLGGISMTGGWSVKFRMAVVGCMIMTLFTNGMTLAGVETFNQQLIRAVMFIGVVAFTFKSKTGDLVV